MLAFISAAYNSLIYEIEAEMANPSLPDFTDIEPIGKDEVIPEPGYLTRSDERWGKLEEWVKKGATQNQVFDFLASKNLKLSAGDEHALEILRK